MKGSVQERREGTDSARLKGGFRERRDVTDSVRLMMVVRRDVIFQKVVGAERCDVTGRARLKVVDRET